MSQNFYFGYDSCIYRMFERNVAILKFSYQAVNILILIMLAFLDSRDLYNSFDRLFVAW